MEMVEVSSVMINGVAHEGDDLYVEFSGGSVYRYWPVDKQEYGELLSAKSVGGYFTRNIKRVKNFERVDENE